MALFRAIFLAGIYLWLTGCSRNPQVRPIFGAHLHGVWLRDDSQVWVVGDEGTILHSNDGGQTWQRRASGTKVPLQLLYGSGGDLWTVGPRGTILCSTDDGQTWSQQASGTGFALYTLHGTGSHLYAVGARVLSQQ
jgi:photosystem II stability/assembly factor-like uncharacterized protein